MKKTCLQYTPSKTVGDREGFLPMSISNSLLCPMIENVWAVVMSKFCEYIMRDKLYIMLLNNGNHS